jgi:hypothetical protein
MAEPWEEFQPQVQPQQLPSWLAASLPPGQQSVSTAKPQAAPQPEPWEVFGKPPEAPEAPVAWSDVPGQALKNLPSSAAQFGSDIYQTIRHPIDTVTSIGQLGAGLLQKAGMMSGDDSVKYADAVGQYFANRYGSMEGFKQALAKDPVGVLGDASTIFSGGGGALARAPGVVGKVGEIARTAGRLTDPITYAGKAAGLATAGVSKAVSPILGLTTGGVGASTLDLARQAGREGGAASEAVTSQMRRSAPITEIVDDAKAAAAALRDARGQQYRSGMVDISKDRSVLDWTGIDNAVNRMEDIAKFKGEPTQASANSIREAIKAQIDHWKTLNPADYHTPEGFDALKKSIGDIKNGIPFENRAGRAVADQAYNAVRDTIAQQAPTYDKVMGDYSRASSMINEIEKTLSLDPKAQVDTTLRKLTSTLRNNVNTNFGRREQLVNQLQQAGAPQLINRIAGSSLSSWTPRGITGGHATLAGLGALGTAIATGSGVPLLGLAAAPLASPRIMGEAFHGVGAAQRYGGKVAPALTPLRTLGRPLSNVEIRPIQQGQ